MDILGTISFKHWVHLQKCLKYEKVRLTHDEREKQSLITKLRELHQDYYRCQLSIREVISKSSAVKKLETSPRKVLGDAFTYVERFILALRNSPQAFSIVVENITPTIPNLELLVESFAFSFFEDLMNPENSELDLLKVIQALIKLEFNRREHITAIFDEDSSSVLSKMLVFYTKRRSQRKYMKLLFKKKLLALVFKDTHDFTIDLASIYKMAHKNLVEVQADTSPKKKKKTKLFGIFRMNSKEEKPDQKHEVEIDPAVYTDDAQVWAVVQDISERICEACGTLLESIYSNVRTMPYGLRWVCKTLSDVLKETSPDSSEHDRNVMLGTFLFMKWWIPAIIRADENGLLSDTIISSTVKKNLSVIGNILKKVFRCEYFEKEEYRYINDFIREHIPRVNKFFSELIDLVDIVKPRASLRMEQRDQKGAAVTYVADSVMWFYYMDSFNRPKVVPARVSHGIPEMNQFQEFKFQAVALSLHEVKILADLIVARQPAFSDPQLHLILTFAKKVKESLDLSFEQSTEVTYLLFLDEKLPSDMEASYMLKNSQYSDSKQPRTLTKVKEAIKNLLFSLDSFAMFFESKDESSLTQITEFVVKFSYLFENSRSYMEEKIPLKILAQYLHSHLGQLPDDYKDNNFRKLYMEILNEYQLRDEQKRQIAHQNKQLLLISINSMEKHITDIKTEEKIQQSFTRTHKFLRFINEAEVPVCIQVLQAEDSQMTLMVASQRECPHARLDYVGAFVIGNRKHNIRPGRQVKGGLVPGHVSNISEFANEFCKNDYVRKSIEIEEDPYKVGAAFYAYMQLVRDTLHTHSLYEGCKDEEIEEVVEDVEKHVTRRMYQEIFPAEPSPPDFRLHELTVKLGWVQPEYLDIPVHNRNEAMWKYAIQALKDTDERMSPVEKLSCLVECITIIVNVLELCSNSDSGISSDDSLPIIIYIVIKAQPKWMYSNLNYINKFRDQSKMLAQSGFCFSQIQSAIQFIENVGPESFSLPAEQYERYMGGTT